MIRRAAKRTLDVVGAASLLALTAPLLGAAALAVRVALGPPVLYVEDRCGRYERPFRLYKLRTMRGTPPDSRDPEGDAARTPWLGRLLRRSSVDELPQLLHVLRGEMSLVGPRPLYMHYLDRYSPRQRRRHEVRPGLTGLAQIQGRAHLGWEERLELDARYAAAPLSLRADLRILALTLLPSTLFAPPHVAPGAFMGVQGSRPPGPP